MSGDLYSRNDCRLCKSRAVTKVIELSPTPPANELLDAGQLDIDQETFPLDIYFCEDCSHLQLLDVVSPERLFRNYVYVSGTSPVFRQHFADYAKRVAEDYQIDPKSLVVDIGSNDGTLLECFTKLGFERVQGVDPATAIAREASDRGIQTIPEFFTPDLAGQLIDDLGHASLVVANNVCAHIDDLSSIVSGVHQLLADRGLFVIEVSYLKDVIEKTLFDTIYHEHLDYHTVGPLRTFLESNGFRVIDTYSVDSHGGSLRLIAMKGGQQDDVRASVDEMVSMEEQLGLFEASTFRAFSEKITALGDQLVVLLDEIKGDDKKIAAFGLPAKATTLMHQFKINESYVDYVVDDNPLKQGNYSPGYKIPIVSAEHLKTNTPDYVIILAWNFAGPIIQKLEWFLQEGGKIIVPLPELRVVGN